MDDVRTMREVIWIGAPWWSYTFWLQSFLTTTRFLFLCQSIFLQSVDLSEIGGFVVMFFFFIPGFLTGPFPCWFAMLIVEFSPSHLRCTWTVEAAGPWSGWTFVATCVEEWRDDGVPPGRFPPRLSSHGSRADYRWLKWARLLSKREWRGGRVSNRFHFTS